MNETFAYFHAAPTNTPSPRYLMTLGRVAPGRKLAPITGSQTATGPKWDRVGETGYNFFGKENNNADHN